MGSLLFQGLFLRLSPRFTLPALLALGLLLGLALPHVARATVRWLPPLVAGLAILGFLLVAALLALWFATAVYRLLPPAPSTRVRTARHVPAAAPPLGAAEPLGRYRRIGLILAGGGAKGAYQAGALAAIHGFLAERHALGSVRMVAATSVGAWNACFWLAGLVSEEPDSPIERWWSGLRLSDIVAPTFYFPSARNYVLSAAPWRRSFGALFHDDPRARARLEAVLRDPDAVRFYVTRTNVERGHLEFSTNRPDLVGIDNATGLRRPLEPSDRWLRAREIDDLEEALFASMDIPPFFEYVRIGDEVFEDGGVIDNLPIYFGTGIEKCDLLFVLPLNASFASGIDQRRILRRMQRVLTIRQGALERKALKDVYLYNELAALRDRLEPSSGPNGAEVEREPAGSDASFRAASERTLADRAADRVHRPVQIFAVCPDEPLEIDTLEFWKTRAAGRAFRLMREHTRYELERFDFDAQPNWIRVALVGPSGEVRYLEDF